MHINTRYCVVLQILWEQTDNSSKVMSLKEIMEREKVDHMLAAGQVSDYQLAMADEKAKQVR